MTDTLTRPTPGTVTTPVVERGRSPWIGFSVVLAAMIMNLLDSTILNVAAPSIQRDLGASPSQVEWFAASYTLAIAVGLLTGGRLGDRYGRKNMLMIGVSGFVAASALCAFAWSPSTLIGARVVQGLFAALLTPQTFGLIRDIFGPKDIHKAFAAFGPAIGLSTVLGPVVAGLLIEWNPANTDWRSLFLINVPIGAFALVVGARTLPSGSGSRTVRLDLVGTVLMAEVSVLLVFPLVDGRTLGWPSWVFAVLVAAVPVLGAFVWQQRRRVAAGRTPLIEMSVLRKRSYASGVVFVLMFFGAIVGFSLTVGLFLQVGLGFSALRASLYLAALAVGAFFGSGVGAWAATNLGRPILHVGLTIMAIGVVVLLVSLPSSHAAVGVATLAPGLGVYGFGMGMIFVPLFSIITGEIDDHEVGSASGMLEAFQQLGASLGVAVLATLFFSRLALERGGPAAAAAAGRHLAAAHVTLLATLVALAVAFVLGFGLPRRARVHGV